MHIRIVEMVNVMYIRTIIDYEVVLYIRDKTVVNLMCFVVK